MPGLTRHPSLREVIFAEGTRHAFMDAGSGPA